MSLGIGQGHLLLAIENVNSGLTWQLFKEHDVAKRRRSNTAQAPIEYFQIQSR